MGTVFLAEHALIKRRVAIKVLHPELATESGVIERFMNEARAAGTLGHPNIVESTDMGFVANRVPYIVFEYLEGALLTDEIYRVNGFTVRRAVRIAQQIASALHAAHMAGIVHRDLKSDNVFLTDRDDALDHVKVLDFGISRFLEVDDDEPTRPGTVMGTPEFMSPEQITDPEHVDRRTDIYSLGVMLYEMLAARRPFSTEDDPRTLLGRIVRELPPPIGRDDVPHALSDMIYRKLLAKTPGERFSSMLDVETALSMFGTGSEGGLRRSRATIPRPMPSVDEIEAVTSLLGVEAPPTTELAQLHGPRTELSSLTMLSSTWSEVSAPAKPRAGSESSASSSSLPRASSEAGASSSSLPAVERDAGSSAPDLAASSGSSLPAASSSSTLAASDKATPMSTSNVIPVIAGGRSATEVALRTPRLDTDEQIAAVALPGATPARKPWLLYGLAGAGLAIGAAGLAIGLRSGDGARFAPPSIVINTPAPAPAPAAALPPPPANKPSKIELRLDANVPNARVTFRRRTLEAPTSLEINESEIVELVEVSAPGYKTQRYWLTFDRPTQLTARMVKGSGTAEASETETLIALGELAQPEPVKPAAVAADTRRMTVKPTSRRKIGRAAARAAVALPDGVVVGPSPAPSDGSDAASAGSSAEVANRGSGNDENANDAARGSSNDRGSDARIVTSLEPKTEPLAPSAADARGWANPYEAAGAEPAAGVAPMTAVATTAKLPAAKPPAAAPATTAKVLATPATTAKPPASTAKTPATPASSAVLKALRLQISAHQADVDNCFAKYREPASRRPRSLHLELHVGVDGKVSHAGAHSELNASGVRCVVAAANQWSFAARPQGDPVQITVPFPVR